MLALTLKHPWGWCFTNLGKDVENRSWKPRHSTLAKGDWFALHGGREPAGLGLAELEVDITRIAELLTPPGEPVEQHQILATPRDELITPGIIAVCQMGRVVTSSDSPWFFGPYGWLIDQIHVLPEPIPCVGALSLWNLPDDIHREVRRQYGSALKSAREQQELFTS